MPSDMRQGILAASLILCFGAAEGQALGNLPKTLEEPAAKPVSPEPPISVAPLGAPDQQATGIISASKAGLPANLWMGSDPDVLVELFRRIPAIAPPAVQDLFRRVLLMEAAPPVGDSDQDVLLARVDTLLRLGEVEAAKSLLERAGPDTPELFQRWFDALLLTGAEDRGCATLEAKPELAPDYETRIFCLARNGRWQTATLTLETAMAIGALDPDQHERMARFLDPDLFDGMGDAPVPNHVTPLDFRILEAIGEPLPLVGLSLGFAQSELRNIVGWKAQIEAAEQLARAGSIPPNVLLGIYTARRPSASGGVWDRVALVQRLDVALSSGSVAGVASYLPVTRAAMQASGLEATLAELTAPRLSRMTLEGDTALAAYELSLLSNGSTAFRPAPEGVKLPPMTAAAAAIVAGEAVLPPDAPAAAQVIAQGMTADGPPESDAAMIEEERLGEALLEALIAVAPDAESDPGDVARALQLLRSIGLENEARHAALQYLLAGTE